MDFVLVVATYSEMVILPDNHILNLKVTQIARILLKMLFKMKLFSTIETGLMFKKTDFWWRPLPCTALPCLGLLFLKYLNNQNKDESVKD